MTHTQDFCLKLDSSEIDHSQVFLTPYIFFTWLLSNRRYRAKNTWKWSISEESNFKQISCVGVRIFFQFGGRHETTWMDGDRIPRVTRPNRAPTRHSQDSAQKVRAGSECRVFMRVCRGEKTVRACRARRAVAIHPNNLWPLFDSKKMPTHTQDCCLKLESSEIDHFQVFLVSYFFFLTKVM